MELLQPGDPVDRRASTQQEIARAVNFVNERLRQGQGGVLDFQSDSPCIVDISNSTGTDFDRHDAVYCSAPIITASDNANEYASRRRYVALVPQAGISHLGKLAVCLEPIPNGKIGKAAISGLVATKVDVIDEADEFCDVDPVSGGLLLTSNNRASSSGHIIEKESGTGEKWATVRLGNMRGQHLLAKIPDGYSISARSSNTPGSGTVGVHLYDPSTGTIDQLLYGGSPVSIEVKNYVARALTNTTDYYMLHCGRGAWWIEPLISNPFFYYQDDSKSVLLSGTAATIDLDILLHVTLIDKEDAFDIDAVSGKDVLRCAKPGLYKVWAEYGIEIGDARVTKWWINIYDTNDHLQHSASEYALHADVSGESGSNYDHANVMAAYEFSAGDYIKFMGALNQQWSGGFGSNYCNSLKVIVDGISL